MTTAQPAAGTALNSDWTTNLIFARNEAETTETTLAAGTGWSRSPQGSGVVFATDADGRYKRGGGSGGHERWSGNAFGPEMTMMAIVKFASSGTNQAVLDSDLNPPRNFIWRMTASGTVELILFDASANVVANFATTATVSTAEDQTLIARIRNDGGTYKAKMWVGSTATTETTCTATPAVVGSGEQWGMGDRLGGGADLTSAKLYFEAIWTDAQSDTDLDALGANGWAIYDAKATGGPTGNFTLADFALTGTFASAPASSLLGTLTLDNFAFTGTLGLQPGRIDTDPFKNWTGTLLPGVTIPKIAVIRLSDMTTVLSLSNQTTAGDGVLTLENAALVTGTTYLVVAANADGTALGAEKYVAA